MLREKLLLSGCSHLHCFSVLVAVEVVVMGLLESAVVDVQIVDVYFLSAFVMFWQSEL